MTEFIQIKEDVFWRYKGVESDPVLSKKIATILGKYPCFQDYSAFQSYSKVKKPPSHAVHGHAHGAHHHGGHHPAGYSHGGHPNVNRHLHYNYPKKPTIVNSSQSGCDREVMALLNKISKRNYSQICAKVKKLVNPTNVDGITKSILEKCQKQPNFLELYISLIQDIQGECGVIGKDSIMAILLEYVEEFIRNRQFTDYHLDSSNYDQFCSNLDNKSQIIGKHKTIIALILKIFRNNLIDEYFNIMFNEIIKMDKLFDADVEDDNEKHELLLDILTDFVKTDKRYKSHIDKYYSTHQTVLQQYSLKARFKVMDLTEVRVVITDTRRKL
jgi:hypothetical protein